MDSAGAAVGCGKPDKKGGILEAASSGCQQRPALTSLTAPAPTGPPVSRKLVAGQYHTIS